MASVQCHKTCEASCQQKNQHGSLGQKVSEYFKGHQHNNSNEGTKVYSTKTGGKSTHTKSKCGCSQTQNTHHTNKGREHKTGFLQRAKDRLSGHSNDHSSSDSESDNEHCHKRKD